MNEFLEKWKSDHRFKTKTKLLVYTGFVVIVAIYAIVLNGKAENVKMPINNSSSISDLLNNNSESKDSIINIPNKYNYEIEVTIDEEKYLFSGEKKEEEITITKEHNDIISEYLYRDDKYYEVIDENFIITTKEEVYNPISYNYLNLENINKYLENATNENNQYKIYLKDIILGSDSEEYITINISDNNINIDYTNLMNNFNNNYSNYLVNIKIEEE